jgi:hypothetical protein
MRKEEILMFEEYAKIVNNKLEELKKKGDYVHWQVHDLLMVEENSRWRVLKISLDEDRQTRILLFESDNCLDAIKYQWQNTSDQIKPQFWQTKNRPR